MILSESELLKNIGLLKDSRDRCDQIERELNNICTVLQLSSYREHTPPIDAIQRAIDQKLLRYRSELAESRGE